MPFLPTISIFFILFSALCVAIGWFLIANDKRKAHKIMMLIAAIFALTFFILYVSRTLIIGNTDFGGPEEIEVYFTFFYIFHIILASVAAIFGIVTITLAFKRDIDKHRKVGPVTSIIWFLTALTSVIIYVLVYVIYDGGHKTSLFRAILGT